VKILITTLLLVLCGATHLSAQATVEGLPKGAVIVEQRTIPSANRALVLWMLNPKRNPTNYQPDEVYTCPEYTRGSYLSGPTRVSLINSETKTLINTVQLKKDYEDGDDNFDLPYAIRKGYYYHVAQAAQSGVEVKPNIIWLRDYNGDGQALEFALFDALACMGLETTLIGYSPQTDKVIHYPIQLEEIEATNRSTQTTFWADYLMSKKPVRPGYWKYEIDYSGRGGTLNVWEVRYNSAKEQFEGKVTRRSGEP